MCSWAITVRQARGSQVNGTGDGVTSSVVPEHACWLSRLNCLTFTHAKYEDKPWTPSHLDEVQGAQKRTIDTSIVPVSMLSLHHVTGSVNCGIPEIFLASML